jgi:hypothetical protein
LPAALLKGHTIMKKANITLNVMAPLAIGEPKSINSEKSLAAWKEFAIWLAAIKALGAQAVTIDVWWGLVEETEGIYNWAYYHRALDYISAAGLKAVFILSFHQCGGNIGDSFTQPIPAYIWAKLARMIPNGKPEDFMYVSESGKVNNEDISPWGSSYALADKVRFMRAFQDHFANRKEHIAEINISLGPAGELRYPSYRDVPYPNRGELQCYSRLARESFRSFALGKYGNVNGVAGAWGMTSAPSVDQINPPDDVDRFFRLKHHVMLQYGWDLFDWYADSLMDKGRELMRAAIGVFAVAGAAFAGIDLGAKIPGVHWRIGCKKGNWVFMRDRLAELPAGLIRTSLGDWSCECVGRGYRTLLTLFSQLQSESPLSRIVLHFTCLEMPNGQDGPNARSLAKSLVEWIGEECLRQGITVKGENALGWNIPKRQSWELMRSHLAIAPGNGAYEGLTVLRVTDVLGSDVAREEFARTAQLISDSNQAAAEASAEKVA